MQTLKLAAGPRRVPVTVRRVGRKLHLSSAYYPELIAELKAMKGAEWKPATKEWAVTDCRRNWMQIELLQGVEPEELKPYDEPLPEVEPKRPSLYTHQRQMLAQILGRRRVILAAEMGTGKTLAVIEAMEHAYDRGCYRWLYVAPAKVLPGIELELRKWGCRVQPKLLSYTKLGQIQSYEGDVEKRVRHVIGDVPHGVIFDESSFVKSPGAKRTRAAMHVADIVRERDGYVVLLSGTPAPKEPTDWWAQAEIACPGFLRESRVEHLRRRLAVMELATAGEQVFAQIVDWKWDEVEKLHQRLEGLVQVHLAAQCQDLPELRYEVVDLPPDDATKRAARLVVETAPNAAQALNLTRQISDGFVYGEDGETRWAGTPKDDALRRILGEQESVGRVVIAAAYTAAIDRVVKVCNEEGWNVLRCDGRGWANFVCVRGEEGQPRLFQASGKPEDLLVEFDRKTRSDGGRLAFVCHPGSGGYGLTLHAARAAVCYSNTFSGEQRWQFVKRIHRAGMDENRGAVIYDLCHLPTDKLVLKNLKKKRQLQDVTLGIPLSEVLDALA